MRQNLTLLTRIGWGGLWPRLKLQLIRTIYIHVLTFFYVFTKGPEIKISPRVQKSLNSPLRIGGKIFPPLTIVFLILKRSSEKYIYEKPRI